MFREANSRLPPENGVLISSSSVDDAVSRIGGTTAVLKGSFVIRAELSEEAKACKPCLMQASLSPNDGVTNLLYNGDLYWGLLDRNLALTDAPVQDLHLPIDVLPLDSQAWTLRTYSAIVIAVMLSLACPFGHGRAPT